MKEEQLRQRAKALGIRNWHNMKVSNLQPLVDAKEESDVTSNEVLISFDSLFATVSESTKKELLAYLDSIETLSEDVEFCRWLEEYTLRNKIVSGTELKVIYRFWLLERKFEKLDDFSRKLDSVCFVNKNYGWEVKDDKFWFCDLPSLSASWHASRWVELSASFDRSKAKSIFSVIFGAM